MNPSEEQFLIEVDRFRHWAETIPKDRQLVLEWEYDYHEWPDVYKAAANLLSQVHIDELFDEIVNEFLYLVAADNGCGIIAAEVAKYPELLLHMAQAASLSSYPNAKWQFAVELGKMSNYKLEAEGILLVLIKDDDEYTRRQSLYALAELSSSRLHEFIEPAWKSNHLYQRIMALSALHKVGSPELERYLSLAEVDGREYLVAWAARIRSGTISTTSLL